MTKRLLVFVFLGLLSIYAFTQTVQTTERDCPAIAKVAYWKYVNGYSRIMIMNLDGSDKDTIKTGHTNHDITPDISSDGRKIAFVNMDQSAPPHIPSRLCVYDLCTGELDTLLDDGYYHDWPKWSPNDSLIAFTTVMVPGDDRSRRIYLINPDGTGIRLLKDTTLDMSCGDWSPDGKKFAFGTNSWVSNGEAYYYDFEGDTVVQLTFDGPYPAPSLGPYSWSPNGRSLLCENAPFSRLVILDIETRDTLTIKTNTHNYAAWGLDGRIYFAAYSGGDVEIFSMNPDGSDLRNISNEPGTEFMSTVLVSLSAITGAICGTVTHDNGNPVANVTVKIIDCDNNQVGNPVVTGSDGAFYFDSLLVGTYSVMIVTPLGYSVSPGETQTGIEVTGYPCTEVHFVLTPTITSNDCRSIGYWKHQFDVYLSGRGHAQEDSVDLAEYLDLVHLHFDVLGVYIDLEDFDFEDAKDVLTVRGGRLMEDRAKQQLFALMLNFASGRIGNETVVSDDGRVAAEAVTYAAALINDGDPANDELAKEICDLINNGQMVDGGIIPESPERYRVSQANGMPAEYALFQSYPNPFNPTCEIAYALPGDCHLTLTIYNILGRKVRVLVDEHQSAGHKSVKWDGKNDQGQEVTSGIYFYRIEVGDFEDTKTMTLVK